jgi:ABC-2 type transport system permease protein
MNDKHSPAKVESASPTWWVVFWRELRDLWIGGKALYLILIYIILLGIYAFLFASNAEVKLLPLQEMVCEIVKASIAVGLFICLIIGADSVSGERERATLEGLLLTPTSRRQIVVGKFFAAFSAWPVALATAIPYWVVLSKGDPILWQALLWGPLLGTLLALALAGLGMLVSIWSNTNKTSMLVSISCYFLLLFPAEIMGRPPQAQLSTEQLFRAELVDWLNPMAATSRFLFKVLVNKLPAVELWFWHTMPVLFTALVLVLLFGYASPGLRLESGTGRKIRTYWGRWQRRIGLAASQK